MDAPNKTIRLREVGQWEDYFRTYYQDVESGGFFVIVDFYGAQTWHTTACNNGEPDMPLRDGLFLEILEGEQVVRKIRIERANTYTAVGIPITDEV